MAENNNLHDAFLDELRDAYDGEKQLTKALAKLAKAATNPDLKAAFEQHLEETESQIERLDQVFASLDERPRGKHCEGIAGIVEEGKSIMGEDFDGATMDACLIAAGQRAEHYEMAAYGTLVAWAKAMGHEEATGILQEILDEEKAADEKLTELAEGGINSEAASGMDEEEEDGVSMSENSGQEMGGGAGGSRSGSRSGNSGRNGNTRSASSKKSGRR